MKELVVNELAKFAKMRNTAVKKDADYHVVDYMAERQRKEAQRKAKYDNSGKKYYEAKARRRNLQEADDDKEGSDSADTSTV